MQTLQAELVQFKCFRNKDGSEQKAYEMVRQARVKTREGRPNKQRNPTGSMQEAKVQINSQGPGKESKDPKNTWRTKQQSSIHEGG